MIPNKVKVAGVEYQVKEVPFVEIEHNRNYQGACRYSESTIEILNSLSKDRKEQVFVHELLHAIFNEAGYNDHEEDMVNRLGIILHQVLKDNRFDFGY
jgi:Zn-dependent peptidase ImmA (M78 family)